MRGPHVNANLITILVASVFILLTCSKDSPSPVEPNPNPTALTVSPSHGAPGTLLNISGYTINPTDTATEIYIGGELSVFLQDSSGMQSMIPLFLDSASHWPAPPTGALDVEIRRDGNVVALAKGAVTVDSLRHADGATATIRHDFVTLANSLRTIWSSLPLIPGEDSAMTGYRQAIMMMLDSTLTGADSSLASVLAGTSSWTNGQTPDLALMDALLASSGALEFYNDAAGSLGRLTDSLTLARQQGSLCRGGGPDMDLACQMQIYVVLDDYANYFVKPTSEGYANTVGLVAGIVAISGFHFPPEAIISALMTVFDFVYGTLAPSLFPAEVTDFTLQELKDTIDIGEYTESIFTISAVNHPATIRATDVLEQLLSALGFAGAPGKVAKDFHEVLVNAINWALDMYRKGVEAYNQDTNNSIFIDPEGELPPMSWGPVRVTNHDLVTLHSLSPRILAVDTAALEWRGLKRGKGNVQVRGRGASGRAKVLLDNSLCLGCVYYGGAFGNDVPASELNGVVVGRPATLIVAISGLPSGIAAAVFVNSLSYESGQLTASVTLGDLDPDDYMLTAFAVKDNNGATYNPSPTDAGITLHAKDTVTIAVHYKRQNAGLFVAVSGLTDGIAGDIDVAGPNGFSSHITGSILLDSLVEGDYTISANSVPDGQGGTLRASPGLQTATVLAKEVTTATVNYNGTGGPGGSASLSLHFGSLGPLRESGKYGLLRLHRASWCTSGNCLHGGYDSFARDSTIKPAEYPEYNWVDNCLPDSGINLAGQSFSVSGEKFRTQASGSVSFTQVSNSEVKIDFQLAGVGAPPPVAPSSSVLLSAEFSPLFYQNLVLFVNNPDNSPVQLETTFDGEGLPIGEVGGLVSLFYPYLCKGRGSPVTNDTVLVFLNTFPSDGGHVRTSRTVSFGATSQEYLGVYANFRVMAGGVRDTTGNVIVALWSSSVSGTITFRLIE